MSRSRFSTIQLPLNKPPRKTFPEIIAMMKREMKRRAVQDGYIFDPASMPPKYEWHWNLGEKKGVVVANTKGEARAFIKKELNLTERLPVNINIERKVNANKPGGSPTP